MLTPQQKNFLRIFYNNLTDRPLDPDEFYYVPFLEEEPSLEDPIQQLQTRITWSESESVSLLTGMRGSGKSTELRRLKRRLEEEGCTVFLCDMRDYMNLTTPVEVTDFLISVMAALSDAVAERFGRNPSDRGYAERVTGWLQSEVAVQDVTVGAGPASVTASLREDPDFKKRLQDHLKGRVARVVQDAHAFAREVVDLVRQETSDPDRKVVLLVDSIEQIRGVGADEATRVYKSVENLFAGHAENLHIPTLHVLYTIPPYLIPLAPGIGRQLGQGLLASLPSVRVRSRDGSRDSSGLAIMKRIVERRCSEWQTVFAEEQLARMAMAVGGDLRDFFRFLRQCLVNVATGKEASLPVPEAIVEQTENHLRREMLPIADEDKAWLRKIAASKTPELESITQLPELARFFDTNLVLNYRDGEDWYDVHPLIAEEISGGGDGS